MSESVFHSVWVFFLPTVTVVPLGFSLHDIYDHSCRGSLGTEAVITELFLGETAQSTLSFAKQSHGLPACGQK